MNSFTSSDDTLAQQYRQVWQERGFADPGQFLARCPDLTPAQLAAVLLVDQQQRWQRNQRMPAEEYLRRYPELNDHAECALDLVYAEFLLREHAGDSPSWQEYADRFPGLAEQLRLQVELHAALGLSSRRTVHDEEPSPSAVFLPTLPGYEVLETLGQGGMGIVYKTLQLSLHRIVAVKMLLESGATDAAQRARFKAEAEAMARLQHPNIVQIFDVSEHAGRPYFAMELVDGPSLEHRLAAGPLPPLEAAALVETLARAITHAHQRGVIHRDLKPSNILLTEDETPKISDFGLVKRLDLPPGRTSSGAVLGTPAYMAPEQAQGNTVGPAVDVYALGTLLYECLTGKPPFLCRTILETLDRVRCQPPTPPRRLRSEVPPELEKICLRCLAKRPRRRFGSATELADALARFRQQPIASPRTMVRRVAVWVVVAALLVLLTVPAILMMHRLWQPTSNTTQAQPQPPSSAAESWPFHPAELEAVLGDEHFRSWGPIRSVACSADGRWLATSGDDGAARVWDAVSGRELAVLRASGPVRGPVPAVAFSPNSCLLAVACHSESGTPVLRLWEMTHGEPRKAGDRPLGDVWVNILTFTPDGRTVVAGTFAGSLVAWDVSGRLQSGWLLVADAHRGAVRGLGCLHDGRLASIGEEGNLKFWERDGDTLKLSSELMGPPDVRGGAIAPDGRTVVLTTADQTLQVGSVSSGALRLQMSLAMPPDRVHALTFRGDGGSVIAAGEDHLLRRYDLMTGSPMESPPVTHLGGRVGSLAFASDGRMLAVGDPRGACLWNVAATPPVMLRRLPIIAAEEARPNARPAGVAWSADEDTVAVGVFGQKVHLWPRDTAVAPPRTLSLEGDEPMSCLAFAPKQRMLAIGYFNGAVHIREGRDGLFKEGHSFNAAPTGVRLLTFLPEDTNDEARLLTVGGEPEVKLWRVNQRVSDPTSLELGRTGGVTAVAASSGEKAERGRLALGFNEGTVQIWEADPEPRLLATRRTDSGLWSTAPVQALAFAPEGSRLAVADADGHVVVWDGAGTELIRWQLAGPVHSLAFSPDGRLLATGNGNGTCYLLRVPPGSGP